MRTKRLLDAALLGWRRPATIALAVVAAACVAGACTTTRADIAARSHTLNALMAQSPADLETVTTNVSDTAFEQLVSPVTANAVADTTSSVYNVLKSRFALAPRAQSWGSVVDNGHQLEHAPAAIQPTGWNPPVLTLGYFENDQQHAELVSGRWPAKVTQTSSDIDTAEIAVTQDTMKLLHAKLGATLDDGQSTSWAGNLKLEVVGVIAPIQPQNAYWQSTGVIQTPIKNTPGLGAPPNWDLGALISPDALSSGLLSSWNTVVSFTAPLDTQMTADQGTALQQDLTTDLAAATQQMSDQDQGIVGLQFESQIGPLLLAFIDAQSAGELQTAMPEAGLGAIALLALLLLLRWTVVVRLAANETFRARGASLCWLAIEAAGESAAVVLPIGAAGWAIGVLPGRTPPRELVVISALLILALPVAIGLWTFWRHRAIDKRRVRRESHQPRTSGYRVARRTVLFATVAVVCALSLQQSHAHGLSPATGIDAVSALAPIAAAGLATLVAAALAPQAIRMLLRPVRARRGVVGLLSLTRMARVPGPALVILLVLSLALCTADLSVALERTPAAHGGAAVGSSAADAAQAGLLMHQSVKVLLTILAGLSVGTACLVVALVALGDATERRASAARLSVMGLTGTQQRSLTLAELSAPLALACLCASLSATPLLWVVRPALRQGFTGDPRMTWFCLAVPVLIVIPAALATGLAGAGLARRGPTGSLRGGDYAEGI
ncbi:hypothetical protein [Actinospica robiniae]|uniref:hypothetical protein n=1 Tax=Actinospica robiniae TaxID=304901 RepID=UPI0004275D8D|nr:hypothetical protein [Actinospica robiniae]